MFFMLPTTTFTGFKPRHVGYKPSVLTMSAPDLHISVVHCVVEENIHIRITYLYISMMIQLIIATDTNTLVTIIVIGAVLVTSDVCEGVLQ